MNICLATSTFPANPDDRVHAPFLLDVIACLRRAGHHVSVLTQAREKHHRPPIEGLEVVWFPWKRMDGRLAEMSFDSPAAARSALSLAYNGTRQVAALRGRVDVFFCAWMIPSGLYLYLDQIFGGRTPYVLWALGSDVNKHKSNPVVRQGLRRIAQRSAHVYADGYRLCEDVRRVTGRDCEFLPTFRSIAPAPPSTSSARGPARFLYVGRHTGVKGTDVLIDALLAMPADEYSIDIAGDGEMTSRLRERIQSAGLSSRVRFRGRLADAELYALYAACDCVVIPSRSESIPIVLSEALQAGKPLIVTDVGDMGSIVREHHLGEVVPSEDPPSLARAMQRFIADPRPPDQAGRARILSDLMFESAAPRLLRRLEEVARA